MTGDVTKGQGALIALEGETSTVAFEAQAA
ncbi:hypothetical protein ABIA33_004806 [Streptacidiphilus sp. MAP12-16]